MSTEDDTFRKLRQRPFEEVLQLLLSAEYGGDTLAQMANTQRAIIIDSGWTMEEWRSRLRHEHAHRHND